MKKTLAALTLSTLLLAGGNAIASDETAQQPAAPVAKMPNPFDATTWFDAAGKVPAGHVEDFNAADPESWMKFVDPKTHTKMHMTFTNPAGYASFMNPATYMQMMNPNVWMKWMNPESYKVMMAPETMTYWMQPGAYMHVAEPTHYMQMMNPDAYTKLMEGATKAMNTGTGQPGTFNFFDPAAWANAFTKSMNQTAQTADNG